MDDMDDKIWPQPESLVLYHDLFATGPGAAMAAFLQALPRGGTAARQAYLDLVRALYQAGDLPGPTGDAWQDYVIHSVLCAENGFTRAASTGTVSPPLREAARWDLMHLQACFRLSAGRTRSLLGDGLPDERLPAWAGRPDVEGSSGPFLPPAFRASSGITRPTCWAARRLSVGRSLSRARCRNHFR